MNFFGDTKNLIAISKILNGLSKSVNLINECKPIYNDLKPLFLKGKDLLKPKYSYYQNNNYNKVDSSLPKFFL